jgi:thioredoxin-like negative regulator of GroEL
MDGCGACHEYRPKFEKVARRYAGVVPSYVLDANEHAQFADRHRITSTPTTLILRQPSGVVKLEGARTLAEIDQMFALAARYR